MHLQYVYGRCSLSTTTYSPVHFALGVLWSYVDLSIQGLENRERMDFLLQRFRADVEEQLRRKDDAAADAVVEQNGDAKQKLKIEVVYCMFGLFNRRHLDAEARDNSGSQAEGRQHLWVARMEDFRHSLYSIYQDRSLGIHLGADTESSEVSSVDTAPERVKVSLI